MADEKRTEGISAEDHRAFVGPDGTNYYIKPPSAEDIREADFVYSKTYSKGLVAGIATAAEMQDHLKRRGTIGPEYDSRLEELTVDITNKITELNSSEDVQDKQRLAREVADLREEIFQWNQRVNGPMSNTCEQISDDARSEYLTTRMVFKEDGNLLWPSYDDYFKEDDKVLTFKARFEVMLYLQGLEPDFLENTPEQVAMREVEQELMDRMSEEVGEIEDTSHDAEEPVFVEKKEKSTKKRKKKTTDENQE
jgi:hypothetical protein